MKRYVWIVEEKVRGRYWPMFAHAIRIVASNEKERLETVFPHIRFRLVKYFKQKEGR